MTLAIGDAAPDASILTSAGQAAHFSDYWRDGVTAFTFIRYLTCVFCKEQVLDYRDHAAAFSDTGVRVVIVTPDDPAASAVFAEELQLPFPILCDPTRDAYRLYEFTDGSVGQLINPRIVVRGVQAALHGNMPRVPRGSGARQLPGTAIIDAEGRLLFHHVASDASEHLTATQLIALLPKIGPVRGARTSFS